MEKHEDYIIDTIKSYLPTTEKETELLGFINEKKEIYTFGHDSKIIGRLFEILVEPYLIEVAKKLEFTLHESTSQTVYPDFYFKDKEDNRYAIDIKSTYRKSRLVFTQGSFTSYLQDGTKNIDGHYDMYKKHYVIMFLYDREINPTHGKCNLSNLDKIIPAYKNVEIAVAEKYRVGGERPGSGNTDNIGTFKSKTFEPYGYNYGSGPFAFLGNEAYEHYWKNYPRNKLSKKEKENLYTTLPEYFLWLEKNGHTELSKKYKSKYNEYNKFITNKGWDII